MPDLSRMNLDDLKALNITVYSLVEATGFLARMGQSVVVDLTPGRAPIVTLTGYIMPIVMGGWQGGDPVQHPRPVQPDATPAIDIRRFVDGVMADMAAPLGASAEPDLDDEVVLIEAITGKVPAPPLPACDEAALQAVEAAPAALLTAGAGPVEPSSGKFGAKYTADDNQKLVNRVADLMVTRAMSTRAAVEQVAASLGRPVEGTLWFLKTKLKAQLVERIDKVTVARPETAPVQTADTEPAGAPPAVAVAPPAPAPVVKKVLPPLVPAAPQQKRVAVEGVAPGVLAHLAEMGYPFGPWTFGKDFDLVRLMVECGWPAHEVALEIGVSSVQLTQRIHKLTDGKKFTLKQLWPGMQHLAATSRAAE